MLVLVPVLALVPALVLALVLVLLPTLALVLVYWCYGSITSASASGVNMID